MIDSRSEITPDGAPRVCAQPLVFYEEPSKDRWFLGDRYPRAAARRLIRGRRVTGYRRLVQSLRSGLKKLGVSHRFNSYRALQGHADQAVGLLGKRHLLENWTWPNPLVAGPCMLDHPLDMPDLLEKYNVKRYLVAGEWVRKMFEPYFGGKVAVWPIGIDTDIWPDFCNCPKSIDFVVYDKILWRREENVPGVLAPIVKGLRHRGFSHHVIRCGDYREGEYRKLLRRSRYMIFLCEHETQGQAYQEALSCNVPVLAWDRGLWLDPKCARYEKDAVPASSVPYFSQDCGLTFKNVSEFSDRLDEFLAMRFNPRAYVERNLNLENSAQRYLQFLRP